MDNSTENGDGNFKVDNVILPLRINSGYGDQVVSQKRWSHNFINGLLVIRKVCIPVVYAAKPKEEIPKKPPLMRYKDLPITECNEFYEYKRYIEDSQKCSRYDEKLLHNYLCPKVHKYRTGLLESIGGMAKDIRDMKNEACESACKNIKCFKKFMRHPDNLLIRKAVVVLGTLTGIYIGSGTRSITKKMFFGTLGALAAGALCFPKETDVIFRNTSYNIVNSALAFYNVFCGKELALKGRIPCREDLPPPPPKREKHQINKLCEDEVARAKRQAKAALDAQAAAAARAAARQRCRDE